MHIKSHPMGAVLYAKALGVVYSLIYPSATSSAPLLLLEHWPVVCKSGDSSEILGSKGAGGLC